MFMEVLYALEKIRNPFLNQIFLAISMLGTWGTGLAAGVILFWCINKRWGYYFLANAIIGIVPVQTVKFFMHVPRPFVKYPDFTVVEAARSTAGDFSFPSGHSAFSVSVFGSFFLLWKKKSVRILCVVMIALVMFSRLYLGVHYPTDVLGGAAIGLAVLVFLHPILKKGEENPWILSALFGVAAAAAIVFALIIEFHTWGAEIGVSSQEDAVRNLSTCAGGLLALAVGVPIEHKYVRFDTHALWWAQVLKAALGAAGMLGLSFVLKPLQAGISASIALGNIICYGIIVFFAVCVWPLTFPFFSRLGKKKEGQQ